MITGFYLENFKSYKKATLPLAPLTLLIGANASGKSNAIEGLRLLSGIARGQYLTDVFRALQKEEAVRGTLKDLIYQSHSTFTLGCSLDSTPPWSDLQITIQNFKERLIVFDENITYPYAEFPLYFLVNVTSMNPLTPILELSVEYNDLIGNKEEKLPISCHVEQAVFTQLTSPAQFGYEHIEAKTQIPRITQAFRQALESVLFLDPAPHRMRGYSFVTDRDLQGDGANLSSVLFDLCEQQGQKERLLAFIGALPEQDIQDITFIKTPRSEVMVSLTESFGGQAQAHDAATLSDGTLRVLAVAAALLSAPQGSVVVIEEIDNGVHPSRARLLLENIQRATDERELHVLLTTHNPALVDALPLKAIPDVVCCYRDPTEGDSRLIRLKSLPDYAELVAQGPVGRLMTRGILERYLKRLSSHSPEQKINEALAWLEDLESEDEAE
jgi:predicted ATPase